MLIVIEGSISRSVASCQTSAVGLGIWVGMFYVLHFSMGDANKQGHLALSVKHYINYYNRPPVVFPVTAPDMSTQLNVFHLI